MSGVRRSADVDAGDGHGPWSEVVRRSTANASADLVLHQLLLGVLDHQQRICRILCVSSKPDAPLTNADPVRPHPLRFNTLTWARLTCCRASTVRRSPRDPSDIADYGYAMPFWQIKEAVLALLLGTENVIGRTFGVLVRRCRCNGPRLTIVRSSPTRSSTSS